MAAMTNHRPQADFCPRAPSGCPDKAEAVMYDRVATRHDRYIYQLITHIVSSYASRQLSGVLPCFFTLERHILFVS